MILKEVEEVVVDYLKSKIFPAVVRKEGRQVVLLADNSTLQVHPALDGSYSNVSWCHTPYVPSWCDHDDMIGNCTQILIWCGPCMHVFLNV